MKSAGDAVLGRIWPHFSGNLLHRRHVELVCSRASGNILLHRSTASDLQRHILIFSYSAQEVFQKLDKWIVEHRRDGSRSRLKRMVPTLGSFFTPLRLVEAFQEYDRFFALSRRTYVPPNFAELRHILNIAQVSKDAPAAEHLKLCAQSS